MGSAREPGWYLVERDAVEDYLPLVRPYIERSLAEDPGKYTVEDIERLLRGGEQRLWLALNDGLHAVSTTELIEYPTGLVGCLIFLAAGKDADFWTGKLGPVEDYARDCGASLIELYGRKGWARVMGPKWSVRVYMRKDL